MGKVRRAVVQAHVGSHRPLAYGKRIDLADAPEPGCIRILHDARQ